MMNEVSVSLSFSDLGCAGLSSGEGVEGFFFCFPNIAHLIIWRLLKKESRRNGLEQNRLIQLHYLDFRIK